MEDEQDDERADEDRVEDTDANTPIAFWGVTSTWTYPLAKFAPALGWHFPHVFGRFALLTDEAGSDDGRIPWNPWHEAQFATVVMPYSRATPWNESM